MRLDRGALPLLEIVDEDGPALTGARRPIGVRAFAILRQASSHAGAGLNSASTQARSRERPPCAHFFLVAFFPPFLVALPLPAFFPAFFFGGGGGASASSSSLDALAVGSLFVLP